MKIAFITNFCPHYRVKTFETLANRFDIDYYFFSAGQEWYWQQQHGIQTGAFHYQYLPGIQWGQTRIPYTLPVQLWKNNYDVFIKCINGRFALPAVYLMAKLQRKPFILWTGIWSRIQTPAHRLFFPLTRYLYRHADAVVVYGDHVKQYLMREEVQTDRIFIASHAVDNSAYNQTVSIEEKEALRRQLNISSRQKIILYLGRLEPGKGLAYLLKAFATLSDYDTVLVIAGTGSEQAALKQMARQKGILDRVRFPGYIPISDTVRYYALAWVYVLPSITTSTSKEPWGLVVNEAFNQRTPVIATDAVGAAAGGLVQDKVNGFIVPERNIGALGKALQKIIKNQRLQQQMGDNAQQIIKQWGNDKMVAGFRQAIASVTKKMYNAP